MIKVRQIDTDTEGATHTTQRIRKTGTHTDR